MTASRTSSLAFAGVAVASLGLAAALVLQMRRTLETPSVPAAAPAGSAAPTGAADPPAAAVSVAEPTPPEIGQNSDEEKQLRKAALDEARKLIWEMNNADIAAENRVTEMMSDHNRAWAGDRNAAKAVRERWREADRVREEALAKAENVAALPAFGEGGQRFLEAYRDLDQLRKSYRRLDERLLDYVESEDGSRTGLPGPERTELQRLAMESFKELEAIRAARGKALRHLYALKLP